MSMYSNQLQLALQNVLRVVWFFHPRVMHDAYIGGNFRRTKITVKPVTWQKTCNYNVLFGSSTRDRHARRISVDIQRITLNASCVTISGGRTEQLDIFCHVTGFTGDFHSCGTYSVLSRSPALVRFWCQLTEVNVDLRAVKRVCCFFIMC